MTNKSFYVQSAYSLAGFIEQELKLRRGVHFKFSKVVSSHKVLTLWLVCNPAYSKKVMGMTKELSQAARLEKGNFIRAEWGGSGVVELQIPKPSDLQTTPKTSQLPKGVGVKTAVGLDTQNQAATVDFANPVQSHCLIAGLSGSGKSNLGRLLTYELAVQNQPDEVKLLLFDVADNGLAWDGFDRLPHLLNPVIGDRQVALDAVGWLHGEMVRRAEARCTVPQIFTFVDEIQELAQESKFVGPIEALARRGRKWGLHLVLATQRPVKESMGSLNIKANLGVRIVGKVTSGQESVWATDLPEVGCETLLGAGDMVLCKPGSVQRIATPLLTSGDLAHLPTNGEVKGLDFPQEDEEAEEESKADMLEPEHIAVALATGRGINWLSGELGVGSNKAKRIKEYAHRIHLKMMELGYTIIPRVEGIPL